MRKRKKDYNGLPTPYEKIYEIGNNKYYFLPLSEGSPFLAIESSEKLVVGERKFFKVRPLEFSIPTNITLVPLATGVVYVISQALQLTVRETLDKGGLNVEHVYNMWDNLDFLEVKKAYIDMVMDTGVDTSWSYPSNAKHKNEVVKALLSEGYHFFGTEHIGSTKRLHWLFKNTLQGNLYVTYITEVGLNTSFLTYSVNTVTLNREIMEALIEKYDTWANEEMFTNDDYLDELLEEGARILAEENEIEIENENEKENK